MASEIKLSGRVLATKGSRKADFNPGTITINMAGTRMFDAEQDIGFAAHELLVWPADFGTAGVGWVRNTDATNYVEIGVDVAATFYPLIKLLAGEGHPICWAVKTAYAKANTAAVKLQYGSCER